MEKGLRGEGASRRRGFEEKGLRGERSSEEKAEQMRKKYSEGVTAISRWFERSEHHRYRIELDFAPRKGASNRRALKQRLT